MVANRRLRPVGNAWAGSGDPTTVPGFNPDLPGQRGRELLGAATTILAICRFPVPDIAGTADARPRIAGAAVRSLNCGSAWSV